MRLYPAGSSFGTPHADLTAANAENRELYPNPHCPNAVVPHVRSSIDHVLRGS